LEVFVNYQIDYKGKKCVVTGAASGMGKSVVEMLKKLDAKIYALDLKEVSDSALTYIPVNFGDKAAIDKAVAALPDGIDAVFHVAGIPGATSYGGKSFADLDVVVINYIGARYFIEAIAKKVVDGGAITAVSSIAGFNWMRDVTNYKGFTDIADWDEQLKFLETKKDDPTWYVADPKKNQAYTFAKECLCIYCMYKSWELSARKIRLNSILPGATLTPMHDDFRKIVGGTPGSSMPTSLCGYESHPDHQAQAMLFLNSSMAEYVSGVALPVDFSMANLMLYGAGKK
jgi:NAD(P)-dependent dehydrogenase (short-subunit alcohol dehydrogenase family)